MQTEKIVMEDGRQAERRTSLNEAGEVVTEIYCEEPRPMLLTKRVTEKKREVLAEQKVERLENGNVVEVSVSSIEPPVMSSYVTKQELGPVITEAVIAAMGAVLEALPRSSPQPQSQPRLTSQAVVENRVEEKWKWENTTIAIMAVVVVLQLSFFAWIMLG